MNIKQLFETDLPKSLLAKTKEVQSVNARFQVNITGEGEWHLDCTSTGPSVTPGQQKADCTLTISGDNFRALMKEPSKATTMLLFGKLKIAGDKMLAMKLTKLLG